MENQLLLFSACSGVHSVSVDIDGLPTEILDLLRVAAILGEDFTGDELAAVSGFGMLTLATRLNAALARSLLVARDARLGFRDEQLRHAVLAPIPPERRAELHREAAQALAAADVPVERIARQLESTSGIDHGWSAGWLARNADELIFRAPELAAAVFHRAHPRFHEKFAEAVWAAGDQRSVPTALALLENAPSGMSELRLRRVFLAANALLRAGRDAEAAELLTDEQERLPDIGAVWSARFTGLRAEAAWRLDRAEECRMLARAAVAEGERLADPPTLYFAARVMALTDVEDGDPARALRWIERGLEALDGQWRLADWQTALLLQRAALLERLDRREEARQVLAQAARLVRCSGSRRRTAQLAGQSAALLYQAGNWDEALEGPGRNAVRALIRVQRGSAEDDDEQTYDGCDPTYPHLLAARRAEAAGRATEAVAHLAPALGWRADDRYFALTELTRTALGVDDETARAAVAAAEADAARPESSARCRAAALLCRGLLDSDADVLTEAAEYFERTGRPLLRARALEGLAVASARYGDDRTAREYFWSALDGYRELGATAEMHRAVAQSRALGLVLRRRAGNQGWEALTPAEARVATLVADGLSNPEIAVQLVVSARTVQTQVSHVLHKLGARSRSEIAWIVARRRLPTPEPPAEEYDNDLFVEVEPGVRQLDETVPKALHAIMHLRAAKLLAEAGAGLRVVAGQLLHAPEIVGGWPLDWLVENAESLAVNVPDLGATLLERAVDRVPNEHPAMIVLREKLAGTVYRLGGSEAVGVLQSLRARAVAPANHAMATYMLAVTHLRQGDPNAALEVADSALTTEPDPDWHGRFLGLRARVLCYQGRYVEAERAIEGLAGATDAMTAYSGHHARCRMLYVRGDLAGALAAADSALEILQANTWLSSDPVLQTAATRIILLDELDRRPEAREALGHALDLGVGTRAQARLALVGAAAAVLEYSAGHWDAARAEIAALDGRLPPNGVCPAAWLPWQALGLGALIAAQRGEHEEADAFLDRLPSRPLPADPAVRSRAGFALMARALRAEQEGRNEDALKLLVSVLESVYAADFGQQDLWLPHLVRLALDADRPDHAEAAVLAAEAAAPGSPARLAAAEHCRGLLGGDSALLASAADYFQRSERLLPLGRVETDRAALLAVRGDPVAARSHLTRAVEAYEVLGAQAEILCADARLRKLGVRRGRKPGSNRAESGWLALTPTELKVAELVAKGGSNPDIARALALSPRTVQTHVSHILAKLGAGSRSQIASAAADAAQADRLGPGEP
jgi:DNA-binding NarL/FixJ family response regulator